MSALRIEEIFDDDDDQPVQPVGNTSDVVDTADVVDTPADTDTLAVVDMPTATDTPAGPDTPAGTTSAAIDTTTATETSVPINQHTPKAIGEPSKMVQWDRSTDPAGVIKAEIATRRIEIPLTFGSEFFQMLRTPRPRLPD